MSRRQLLLCPDYCQVTGRPPYGYRLRRGGVAVFEPDPLTAPVVRRIFEEYVSGSGLQVIAERLTAAGIPRPSAYDPERNPHHQGSAWSKAAVRAIITNDRYAPAQAGPATMDCVLCTRRCASRHRVTLVPVEVYHQTQELLAARGRPARGGLSPERVGRRYVLRGLLRCELCQRLMQGTWNNDAAYYRCRFPREYARAHSIDHPANVYIRQDRLLDPLLSWVCGSLPAHLHTLAERQSPTDRHRLAERCHSLRDLVTGARWDTAKCAELYSALGMRLTYQPTDRRVQVRAAVLPGVVVDDAIELSH